MATVRIYLRGGQTLDVQCDSFRTERSTTNDLRKLAWTNARPNPLYLRLDDISAVVEIKSRRG